jgi:hypothetical protein
MSKYEINTVKCISAKLKGFCYLCAEDNAYITVTAWQNGEGHEIEIQRKHTTEKFGLTHGELEALVFLRKALEVGE